MQAHTVRTDEIAVCPSCGSAMLFARAGSPVGKLTPDMNAGLAAFRLQPKLSSKFADNGAPGARHWPIRSVPPYLRDSLDVAKQGRQATLHLSEYPAALPWGYV